MFYERQGPTLITYAGTVCMSVVYTAQLFILTVRNFTQLNFPAIFARERGKYFILLFMWSSLPISLQLPLLHNSLQDAYVLFVDILFNARNKNTLLEVPQVDCVINLRLNILHCHNNNKKIYNNEKI